MGSDLQEEQDAPPLMESYFGGEDPETHGASEITPMRSSTPPLAGEHLKGDHPSVSMDQPNVTWFPSPSLVMLSDGCCLAGRGQPL